MMSESFPKSRSDVAVIMARGQSRRMGQDKGTVRLTEDGPTLLEMVDSLYRGFGIPRLVVTLPELLPLYQPLVDPEDGPVWLAEAEGGDTAWTLGAAWRFISEARGQWQGATHLWAHPVDLPLVTSETLEQLKATSLADPGLICRPGYSGEPGHPVIIPGAICETIFQESAPSFPDRSMWQLLQKCGLDKLVNLVEVQDRGVVQDFDKPDDLLSC